MGGKIKSLDSAKFGKKKLEIIWLLTIETVTRSLRYNVSSKVKFFMSPFSPKNEKVTDGKALTIK